MACQKIAFNTYKHKYNGWNVRSIDAYEVKNLGLFMEEAKGKTARKILDKNPKLYREAMRAMAKAEVGLLRGQDSTHNLKPKAIFANPDFHDGQVLIDEATKSVTILDFGQAVPITNQERELGLDLLTVLGKLDTMKGATKRLNKRFFHGPAGGGLTPEDLKPVWKCKKKMDMFVHLLSVLASKGADVPLSTIHWVLALNRQLVLGDKLHQSIKAQMVGMVLTHKMGMPLRVFNTVYAVNEKVKQWGASLGHCLGSWALGEPKPAHEEAKIKAQGLVPNLDAVAQALEDEEPYDAKIKPVTDPERWEHKDSFAWYPEEHLISDGKG
jgi:hypothetical protein